MGKRIAFLTSIAFGVVVVTIWGWLIRVPRPITLSQLPPAAVQNAPKEKLLASTAEVEFGTGRGFYETAVSVELVCATPGAVIRYTTDGTEPTATAGLLYSEPIQIDRTTVLRAAGFKPEHSPSVVTHTYIFPRDVITSRSLRTSNTKDRAYGSQLFAALKAVPSLSLVTSEPIKEAPPSSGGGRVKDPPPVKASLEWLAVGDGPGFQEDCGVEYYGGDFTPFEKKNFRLHFRREFGASVLNFPLFAGHEHGFAPVEEFDQLELRGGSHDMAQRGFYVSNIFADDSMLEMGHLNPHGRFVHLYLNGVYWGVFHLRERWGADMHQRYLGGASSDYESINGNLNVRGWAPGKPYDGDGKTWARIHSLRGNYKAVRQWVDLPNYIDFMILWTFGRCEDEYRCVGPTVPGSGFKFYLNDADGFFQSPAHRWYGEPSNRTARGAPGRQPGDGPASIFSTLLAEGDPDYRTLLADRIYKAYFNGGALTFTSVSNRLKTRCDELEKVFVAEAARWAYRAPDNWRSVRDDVLNHWLPTRTKAVLAQLLATGLYPSLDAPTLKQQGGQVTNGFQVSFLAPPKSVIFFTVDGSDPRLPGGEVAPSARQYRPGVAGDPSSLPQINGNTVVKSRARDGKQWSALNEAFFQTGPPLEAGEISITKLNFDPKNDADAEFVELSNVSSEAVNLRGARVTEGIDYLFADNRDTILASGQKLLLTRDLFRFRQLRGLELAVEGIYTRNKNKAARRITLLLKSDQIITSRPIDQTEPSSGQ